MLKRYGLPVLAVGAALILSAPASAMETKPGWELTSTVYPTNLTPGGTGVIVDRVYNVGGASSSGTVTVTDTLPPGVKATSAGESESEGEFVGGVWDCAGTHVVTCTNDPIGLPSIDVSQGQQGLEYIHIAVEVEPGVSGVATNEVTVAGGGAPNPASATGRFMLSSTPSSFGFADFNAWYSNADGTVDTQAGSHPYEVTVEYHLNTRGDGVSPVVIAGGESRDITTLLPPGLVGNPTAVPQCTREQLDAEICPASAQIGVDNFGSAFTRAPGVFLSLPVYNMVPPPGVPAQFAFDIVGIHQFLDATVRSGGNYGITEHANNVPQRQIVWDSITIWGVPAEGSHDVDRCGGGEGCGLKGSAKLTPFLTLPTSCEGPQRFTMMVDTWESPVLSASESLVSHDATGSPAGFTGCDHLGFGPSISVAPDTSFADTPAGLTVEVKVPQDGLSNTEGLSTSNIKGTTVTLPKGVVINPGQAAGLAACPLSQDGVGTEDPPSCPLASKVGTVEIQTPLLTDKLEGNVYVLQSDPPNLKLLVAASGDGVNLKLVGDVHLDGATGQLTTTFEETPELPFTDFKLAFSGGAQAALATPTACGVYSTTSDFVPWSTPLVQDVFPSSSFAVTSGPGGSACSAPMPFTPTMIAGSTTDQAGGYTNFSLLLQRADGQQRIDSLQFKTPEGLLGMISKVPLCQEPQAAAGTCSSASQIGHTVVQAGPGPYPLVVPQPGQPPAPIYLTGPYEGAPYGLSIVVPLVVGPFTLQTQVVRGRIEVDPHTARLTVTTDPLPTIIDGIPADLRTINAVIDKPGFMFNPTNCSPQAFSGTATSTEGAQAAISSPFQMGSCRSLTFKPNFKVSTSGKTSRANGASLGVKLTYPTGALGANQASSQSNIKSVKVDLPKQLPSRLTTLQKACAAATFNANPASCPAASKVGTAKATTPILSVPLTGPAYFVSHGGEEFPSLIVVLQGSGVTVDLVGTTFISKGITSSTFRTVPDVPVGTFELTLPQGKFSALAANGNLCKSKLKMPTAFVAQNGAVIHQSTPISVTGCPKKKAKAKAKKK
jgi:hypothetical protein